MTLHVVVLGTLRVGTRIVEPVTLHVVVLGTLRVGTRIVEPVTLHIVVTLSRLCVSGVSTQPMVVTFHVIAALSRLRVGTMATQLDPVCLGVFVFSPSEGLL